jgi:hypothetical protein
MAVLNIHTSTATVRVSIETSVILRGIQEKVMSNSTSREQKLLSYILSDIPVQSNVRYIEIQTLPDLT